VLQHWLSILISTIFILLLSCSKQPNYDERLNTISNVEWTLADSIYRVVHIPEFPDHNINIVEFGAVGDSESDCTTAIQAALDKVSSMGGGSVVVPAGIWLTGPIHLKDNTNLHLEEDAQIIFTPDPGKYPNKNVRFYGIPCMNYSPMIFAKDVKNIAVTGKGSINGQGNLNVWRKMKYKTRSDWNLLKELDLQKLDIEFRKFGAGYNLRPDLIGIYNSSNILIEGIEIKNAPLWGIKTVLSSNITLRHLNLSGIGHIMNGISPESSQMVVIEQVSIKGVGEGIQVSSGRNEIKGNKPSENILIKNIEVQNAQRNGIGIGMNIHGGIGNIFVEESNVNKCNRAFTIKASPRRGGYVKNVFFRDCKALNVYNQVLYTNTFHESTSIKDLPSIHNIHYENIMADSCGRALYFEGSYKRCIENVFLTNCSLNVYKSSYVEDLKNLNMINVTINDVVFSGKYDIGKILDEEDNEKDELTLNTDNLSLDELPEIVRTAAEKTIAGRELTDIDRKIMKTGVIYEISYRSENLKETDVFISSEGKLLGYEVDIWYNDIPDPIRESIITALGFQPVEQQFSGIKIKHVEGFKFYDIEVETLDKIFKLELSDEGEILVKRERLIKSSFPPIEENT